MPSTITDDIKSARKFENINDPIDTHIVDYIAMVFSRIFIKLHIIPNVVTVLSGLVGVTGGVMLCLNTLPTDIAGVILIIFSAVFDACDGQVARLTKHYSNLGRTLDGLADFLTYLSMHIAICIRMYNVNIPFTDRRWGNMIIPVAIIALYFYIAQSSTADYYKNLHMFMVTRGKGSELSRTASVKDQIAECRLFTFEHFRLSVYRIYTASQEIVAPQTQKLLSKIEANGGVISEAVSDKFYEKSKKYVMSTNLLTFNLRTITLFLLLFLPWNIEYLFFPFVIFVLEAARWVIISKFEKLSRDTTKFLEDTEI